MHCFLFLFHFLYRPNKRVMSPLALSSCLVLLTEFSSCHKLYTSLALVAEAFRTNQGIRNENIDNFDGPIVKWDV